MQLHRSRVLRFPAVALAVLAWVSLTNHCAIAVIEAAARPQPMPSCHHDSGNQHTPGKDKGCDFECCKTFSATLAKSAKKPSAFYSTHFAPVTYFARDLGLTAFLRASLPLELDTGPPFVPSFAESVLQQSILAHAPPFFA